MFTELKSDRLVVVQGEKAEWSFLVNGSNHVSVEVGEGARLVLQLLTRGNTEGRVECKVDLSLMRDSSVRIVSVDAAEGDSDLKFDVNLCQSGANFEFHGLYIVAGQEHKNTELDIRHLVADCYSNEQMRGIAAGDGEGRFHGRIYVAEDAQRTQAYQQSRNLLLSDTARIFTEPQLEIYADDVKCSHGAVVGQIEDEAVYYMRQRGIEEKDARRLLTEGFAAEVVWACDEKFAEEALTEIESRLSRI